MGKAGAAGPPEAPAPQQKVCLTCHRSFDLRHFKQTSSQPDGRWVSCRGCSHVKKRLDGVEREMAAAVGPGLPLDRCLFPVTQQLRRRHHAQSCFKNSRAQVWFISLPAMLRRLYPGPPVLNRLQRGCVAPPPPGSLMAVHLPPLVIASNIFSGMRWRHRVQARADIFGIAEIRCNTCKGQLPATFFGVKSSGRRQPRCHACRGDEDAQRRMQLIRQARTGPSASVCYA